MLPTFFNNFFESLVLKTYQIDQKIRQILQKMVKVENTDSTKNTYSLVHEIFLYKKGNSRVRK